MICKRIILLLIVIIAFKSHLAKKVKDSDENLRNPYWLTFKKAEKYYFENKNELALFLFEKIEDKFPENAALHSYMGDIYLKKSNYKKAENRFKIVLSIKENAPTAFFQLGQVYFKLKDAKNSVKYFTLALQSDAKLKFALFHRGKTHLILNHNKKKVIQDWQNYLKIVSKQDDSQWNNIQKAVNYLKTMEFPQDPDVDIVEFLKLGKLIDPNPPDTSDIIQANESEKESNKTQDIVKDDGL